MRLDPAGPALAGSVRPAIASDLEPLGRVHVQAWREAYSGILPAGALARMSPGRAARDWERAIATGESLVYVAHDGLRLLGYGTCGPQRHPRLRELGFQGEIETLYLLRAAQGRGLGRALVAEMAEALAGWGCRSASLWVLAGNGHARGFYAHLGGRPVARRAGQWGGRMTDEVAYGWRDLAALARGPAPTGGRDG